MDDLLNAHWTGVMSGLFLFLSEGRPLVPFALFPHKLFLCRPSRHESYRAHMRTIFDYGLDKKDQAIGGHIIDVFGECWPSLPRNLRAVADTELVGLALPRSRRLSAVSEDLANAERRAADLSNQLGAMRESHSWRLTAPVRFLGRLLKSS